MKRKFAFNSTVLMGYNKYYSIDLTPIGFHATHLITPFDGDGIQYDDLETFSW